MLEKWMLLTTTYYTNNEMYALISETYLKEHNYNTDHWMLKEYIY